ncbi:Msr family ABC-F type ribosomal protection protein [Peptostreptococcaceae bacterium OttesenSCG-928-C18]|nr:Msr family ABC-F type ribosomal protection protein [Peptostreptococcaceae bacterium OttesenSCG-928-C18]
MELIIKANDIRVEYTGRDVLDIDELELYSYDRIGLIGNNGEGKSTLLNILAGGIAPSECKIQRFGEIAYIQQLESIMLEEAYDPAMLSRLGVSGLQKDTMSGGEETRSKIAIALSKQVHALFADEPTCHLDRAGIELLIGHLKSFDGALLIISHDRYFLDKVVDKIWELKDGKITEYWGGYSDYLNQKEVEREQKAKQYEQIKQERERLERAAEEKRNQARQIDNKQKGTVKKNSNESTGRLGHQKSTGSKQKKIYNAALNMERKIEKMGDLSASERIVNIRFRQSKALELHNKFPVVGDNINLKFGERVIFESASFNIPLGAKVALTGGNGTGKTTLLKMVLSNNEMLTISPKAVIGYFAQTGYQFIANQSVISFMQEDCDYQVSEIRGVLASMGFRQNDINKDLSVLSGGEIIKLLLSKMLLGRYNILLMDEPANYLDIFSMEALESMIKNYAGTILFVSHDKKLIDNVADIVYEIRDCKIHKLK